MTQETTPADPNMLASIFEYAAHAIPSRPINLLVLGGDIPESQRLATSVFGARLSSSRFMLSLKGYSHGNTKKPDPGTIDLLIVDARDHDKAKLAEGMTLALEAVAPRGRLVWIVPSSALVDSETQSFRHTLTDRCSVFHIHIADTAPNSALLWIGNAQPSIKQTVVLSRGGPTTAPKDFIDQPINVVRNSPNWLELLPDEAASRDESPDLLSQYFEIRRGVTTPDDEFFILPVSEIEKKGLEFEAFRPVLPDPIHLHDEIIESRPGGFPDTDERLAILQIAHPDEMGERYPNVAAYLAEGESRGLDERSDGSKQPDWYALEKPAVPPIVIAARDGQPCCFFLNRTNAIATDKYLALYPKEKVAAAIATNATLVSRIWSAITAAIENTEQDITVDDLAKFEVPGLDQMLPR